MALKRLHIVLQETLYEAVRTLARTQHRSANAQITYLLEQAVHEAQPSITSSEKDTHTPPRE